MKKILLFGVCAFLLLCYPLMAQTLEGRVISYLDDALTGCTVSLPALDRQTQTVNGLFQFDGMTPTTPDVYSRRPAPVINGNSLVLRNMPGLEVSYKLLDTRGKVLTNNSLKAKGNLLSINIGQLTDMRYNGLFTFILKRNTEIYTYKVINTSGGLQISPAMPNSSRTAPPKLKKSSITDTVTIHCDGFSPEYIPIDNYSQNMGDLTVEKPNFIFILVDDMGYSDIGPFGSEIATPNLDRLANNGQKYTQFYNTSKCFPTRAVLLTGAYAQQVGMSSGYPGISNGVTFGEVLKDNGYRTLASGKHHSNVSLYTRGFDRYFGLNDGATNHFNPSPTARPGEPDPAVKRNNRFWVIDEQEFRPYTPPEADFYSTDYYTNYAIDYLEEYKDENKPFVLYLSYTAPHDPLQAWPEDIEKYRGNYMEGFEPTRAARFARQKELGMWPDEMELSASEFANWSNLSQAEKEDWDLRMAVYAAMIDCVDQNIGRLIAKLEELGKFENTLIMFASDNGGSAENVNIGDGEIGNIDKWASVKGDWANVSNTPFRKFKNFSHEGGISSPLVAHWPRVIKPNPNFIHSLHHFVDVMATFVDITAAEYPTTYNNQTIVPLQGTSLYPIFKGEPATPRSELFWQWGNGSAVRQGDFKIVKKGDVWELYDMSVDRTEENDLAGSNASKLNELTGLYDAWFSTFGL